MNEQKTNNIHMRSIWLKCLVALTVLDAVAALSEILIIAFCINVFIAYRLWQKNKFWRNITAYIRLPLGFFAGLYYINSYDYTGEFIIIEAIIFIVLLAKSWDEFDEPKLADE